MLKTATWAKDFYNGNIAIYTGIEGWIRKSRNWMKKFLIEKMGCKPEDIIFNKMWCEWSMFAKIGEQWWYFNSGDPRMGWGGMLIRKASSPKDYTGGRNESVFYGSADFTEELEAVLKTGHTQCSPLMIWSRNSH
jgi:hypothetical protein